MTGVTLRLPIGHVARESEAGGGDTMAKVAAFHSKLPGTDRHHNNNKCIEGFNIDSKNRVAGTGGHPLCSHCAKL
jgi:hypothetical protein